MSDYFEYNEAVEIIKSVIIRSQYVSAKVANENQLVLYFYIGKYISRNTRSQQWGRGAIEAIAERLGREMPGLRGVRARNLRYMRSFYEEWTILDGGEDFALPSAKSNDIDENQILHLQVQKYNEFPMTDNLTE